MRCYVEYRQEIPRSEVLFGVYFRIKMALLPKFRRFSDGKLVLGYTTAASKVMKSKNKPIGHSKGPEQVSVNSTAILLFDMYFVLVYKSLYTAREMLFLD